MAKKARMTVFSRLMLLMLFVGPLSYIVASYFNGEDGIHNITSLVNKGKEKITKNAVPEPVAPPKVVEDQPKVDSYEIQKLKKQMDELYKENEQLKRKIQNLEQQMQQAQ